MLREVDFAHAPAAQSFLELVLAELPRRYRLLP